MENSGHFFQLSYNYFIKIVWSVFHLENKPILSDEQDITLGIVVTPKWFLGSNVSKDHNLPASRSWADHVANMQEDGWSSFASIIVTVVKDEHQPSAES